jgi:FixJ family two-component response regulator
VCGTACTRSVVIGKQLDFLTKPFTSQHLLRKVKEALTAQIS